MLARAGMSSTRLNSCFSLLDGAYMGYTVSEKKKNPHAVALSKLGAKKGGETRAAVLSAEQRREIAQRAARARWAKSRRKPNSNQ